MGSMCCTCAGIIPRAEKPEIKTVRIVKRESERRNRVKRPNTLDGDLIRVMEEDQAQPPPPSELELSLLLELQAQQEEPDPNVLFQRSLSLPRGFGKQPPPPPPMRAPSPRSESGTLRAYATRYRPPVSFQLYVIILEKKNMCLNVWAEEILEFFMMWTSSD
jgi:hypothetical protein